MPVAVVIRRLRHAHFKQRQIRGAAFRIVRVVLQPYRQLTKQLRHVIVQYLVYRMRPAAHAGHMDFLIEKLRPVRAVRLKAPHILIAPRRCTRLPVLLQRPAPAGTQYLVKVGANENIRLRRHELHALVPRHIKAPRLDLPALDQSTERAQQLRRTVRASRIEHRHAVRLAHRRHPACRKLCLILCDGVHPYIHASSSPAYFMP